MQYDEVLQATLFLSCYFNSNEVRNVKPLTPTEYARLAAWLHSKGLSPASLLHDQESVLAEWQDPKNKITAERIKSLFSRGASMGFALEHWDKHGIWVVPRASQLYPKKIRVKIGDTRPPILFGVGNKDLLNKPGIGFVGSRSIAAEDEGFAKTMAELAVNQGYVVVSGGAKGIDQTAMASALNYGGESVGILADSLLRASVRKIYREGLRDNKLALISPFYPEAGFSPGNAMARNKYIYAMSESVVVVKSDFNKGGTWSGAVENLKKQWVPLLVRGSNHQGNQELVKLGGQEIDESFTDFNQIPQSNLRHGQEPQQESQKGLSKEMPVGKSSSGTSKNHKPAVTDDLFNAPVAEESASEGAEIKSPLEASLQPKAVLAKDQTIPQHAPAKDFLMKEYGAILQLFVYQVTVICERDKTVTPGQLLEIYPELTSALIKKWLKLLEEQGYLARTGRKLIYQLTDKTIKA